MGHLPIMEAYEMALADHKSDPPIGLEYMPQGAVNLSNMSN